MTHCVSWAREFPHTSERYLYRRGILLFGLRNLDELERDNVMDVLIIAVAGTLASRSAAVHVRRYLADMGRFSANIAGVVTRYFGLGLTMLMVGSHLGMPTWVTNTLFVTLIVSAVIVLGYALGGKERARARFPMSWYRNGTHRAKRMMRRTGSVVAQRVMEQGRALVPGAVIGARGTA